MPSVVNETNFQREVLEVAGTVLVHFWTPWCGLCKLISPMLESMENKSNEAIKIVAIDADKNFKLANSYRLRNLPTIMLFKDGELVTRLDNFNSRDRLRAALDNIMNNTLSMS